MNLKKLSNKSLVRFISELRTGMDKAALNYQDVEYNTYEKLYNEAMAEFRQRTESLPDSDSENGAETSDFEDWLELSPRMWYIVKKAKIYHEILDIAARSRSVVKVIEHIRHTHDELLRLGQWIPPLHAKPEWINEYEGSE